jgi:hypothetical protein
MDGAAKYVYGAFRRMINCALHLAAFRRRVFSIQIPFSDHGQDIFLTQRFLTQRGMVANGATNALSAC